MYRIEINSVSILMSQENVLVKLTHEITYSQVLHLDDLIIEKRRNNPPHARKHIKSLEGSSEKLTSAYFKL